jgi:uncharacterized phiE125 gp8 family phage protein
MGGGGIVNDLRTTLSDTGAATAATSLADAKTHCRVYHTQDDSYLTTLILAATDAIERETRRALINRTFAYQLEAFPANGVIELPRSPLQSVTSVTYVDSAGASQTLSAGDYVAYSVNGIGRVQLKSTAAWPSTQGTGGLDVTVTFVAGYGAAAANVPALLRQAVLLQTAHLYDTRAPINIGNIVNEIPRTVERLIVQYHSGDYA